MIRCYKYWAVPVALADATALNHQLKLASDYRHVLVEIENRARQLQRALWAQPMREIPQDEREAWRANGGDAILRAWVKTDEFKGWRERIQKASFAAAKAAYNIAGDTGLAWGTRLVVGEAVDGARRTTAWGSDLKHRPCRRVAVQIQITRPLSTAAVFGEDTRLRIGAEPYALGERVDGYRTRAHGEVRNRGGRVRPCRLQEASIRVASDGRAPVWARLHILMHRPLPPGQIKGAWAGHTMVGGREHWEFILSVDVGEAPAITHSLAERAVAIDVGWRRRPDGMRVAYWLGDDGDEAEVVIPVAVEQRKAKSDDLQAIRANNRNALASELTAWAQSTSTDASIASDLKDEPASTDASMAPDSASHGSDTATSTDASMASDTEMNLRYVKQWTKIWHFVRLERDWRNNRLPNDAEIYAKLVAFLKQDRHLWMWQSHNLTKMKRQISGRLDAWAHELCQRYSTIVVEKLDLTKLKELPDEARINSRSIQRLAPGEVLRALKQAAPKYGARVIEQNAAYTTIDCPNCGHERKIADASQLVLACDECGATEDQDRSACRNLLASERVSSVKAERKRLPPRHTRKQSKAFAGVS